jgi:type IV pilus assembly protein PilW
MNTPAYRRPRAPLQAGFSLVEIMVALVIGMLAMIVMMQLFSVSEGYKRSTTGGADAQTIGAIALFGLQRDIRQSGYGIGNVNLMACDLTLPSGKTIHNLAPLTINPDVADLPAGDANSDTLLTVYGSGNGSSEGDLLVAVPGSATVYPVQTPTSFAVGDRIIAERQPRPTPCLLSLDPVVTVVGSNVTVTTGTAGLTGGSILYNLGPNPKIIGYAIRQGNLTMCDYADATKDCSNTGSSNWIPIANNVVSLRAQYGRDSSGPPMDAIIDMYDQTTPTTACGWARISALRLALVTRNSQTEKIAVTTAAPTWEGSAAGNPGASTAAPIDLSGNASWQNFRYRVFQTTVPLRNMAWAGVQSGC